MDRLQDSTAAALAAVARSVPPSAPHQPAAPTPAPLLTAAALRCLDVPMGSVDADAIINAARADSQGPHGTEHHLMAGSLSAAVRFLAAELNRLRGVDLEAQIGAELITLPWGDAKTIVEFEFEDGADADQATIIGALLNGKMVNAEEVATAEQLTEWREAIGRDFERRNDEAKADEYEAMAVREFAL